MACDSLLLCNTSLPYQCSTCEFLRLLKPDLIKRALLWIKTTLQGANTYSFSVVIWNLDKKEAICGAPAAVPSAGTSYVVAFSNHNDELFVTSGK